MAAKRPPKRSAPPASGGGVGVFVFIAVILAITVAALLNKDALVKLASGAPDPKGQTTQGSPDTKPEAPVSAPAPEKPAAPVPAAPAAPAPAPEKPAAPEAKPDAKAPAAKPAAPEKSPEKAPEKPAEKAPAAKPAKVPETAKPAAAPEKKPPKQEAARERTLWFVKVDSAGAISRVKEKRSFPASDSPMADALAALMAGPTEADKKRGVSSLIPEGTKLVSATVRGATAYLSFNDRFEFNSYGVEGFTAQLRQIVWTATEFESVKDVQILIEGRRVDYLGSEGLYIGAPLNRTSL